MKVAVKKQTGGGSDYSHLFHAPHLNPRDLSALTLANIDKSPMFNPLSYNTVIPTGTSGVVPTGAFLFNDLKRKEKVSKN